MYVLRLQCDDKPGIVAAVASALSNNQCNIEESSQFNDSFSGQFFMRVVFTALQENSLDDFKGRFDDIAKTYAMRHHVCDLSKPIKTLVMVSQHDHCLYDLLYRWKNKSLPLDIVGVVSNHNTTQKLVEDHGLAFHKIEVTPDDKKEDFVQALYDETGAELIVLARYMQVLSNAFCTKNEGHIINIHHSFLPGFKGARPYNQAYERGVKITGATAHFATADLDEGPIITQDIVPVDHSFTPQMMQRLGQDTEARVLARAVGLFAERRIFIQDRRTIIL